MSTCKNSNYADAAFAFYRYEPSQAGAIAFAVLFAITTVLHVLQMYRTKTWYLTALIVGGVCETFGFGARAASASDEPGCWGLGPYIMQNVLILIAPAFMAASIYMILGRIVLLTKGEKHSLIKLRWLTKLFVTGDVISLLMQSTGTWHPTTTQSPSLPRIPFRSSQSTTANQRCSGGGMMAAGEKMAKTGENMVIFGLFVQLAFFGFFISVAAVFHRRMSNAPTPGTADPAVRWRQYLVTLYVTSALIFIRSVFRAAEYIEGNHGVLMRSEAYLYFFDALLMLIVMCWMNWFHPSEIGLLLRGQIPTKNGFQLINMRM
ncbi:Protein RTA1-like protein 8 [Colletotrichum plurivorum]|uniref:Protein RTA1-like protein 8 n=1 Tax=Colletotrichum plurivorum TaxID=2175906 RepID=A0A8H6JV57_9PEZI|nr:Protein RTA1-like protein 8 [Colletotrichum plurivorum]